MEQIKKQKEMHYWVYDSEGALIGITSKEEEKKLSRYEYLRGVSCFVINEDDEILIEKRVDKGLTPGKLDLCSGHIDGNEFDFQAMSRELREELGIEFEKSLNIERILKEEFALGFRSEGQTTRNFYITFFGIRVKKADINFNKEEVQAIAWLNKEKVFELIKNGETKFPKECDYERIFEALTEKFFNKEQEKEDEERE